MPAEVKARAQLGLIVDLLLNSKSGKVIKKFKPLNLDNIYKLAYKNGNILTAGQDRRVGVYPKNGTPYYIKSDFFIRD